MKNDNDVDKIFNSFTTEVMFVYCRNGYAPTCNEWMTYEDNERLIQMKHSTTITLILLFVGTSYIVNMYRHIS